MTKPLFSIPPHQFLFNAGSIDKRSYMDMLQLEESEYNLIKFPSGVSVYISAEMNDTCWRFTLRPTKRSSSDRQVVADGSFCCRCGESCRYAPHQ